MMRRVIAGHVRKGAKGQSTLEYILVLIVILVAIIAATQGIFKNAVNRMMNQSSTAVENAANKITNRLGL